MKALFAALAIALTPLAAAADTLVLVAPNTGAGLHDGAVDLSVYYTVDDAGTYTLVGTYAPEAQDVAPRRFVMLLDEGGAVHFGLPGQTGTIYGFVRTGDAVVVSSAPVRRSCRPAANPDRWCRSAPLRTPSPGPFQARAVWCHAPY